MQRRSLPGSGPWSWLEPGLWVYRSRELDLLAEADRHLAEAVPAARAGGQALLAEKHRLHAAGIGAATAPAEAGGGGHRFAVQVGIQFLAGYRDLNLRDAAHVGHGAVLCQDPLWWGRRELADVINGALVGLAATEPADDPGPGAVATLALPVSGGYEISGQKKWVSRLLEAEGFVVFARSPEHLAAFYVPADSPGLRTAPAPSAGAGGWSRGALALDAVRVPATSVIGAAVGGVAVFRRHLTGYRPLVAAACLGAAAACVDALASFAPAGSVPAGSAQAGSALAGSGTPGAQTRHSPPGGRELVADLRGRLLLALSGLLTGAAQPDGVDVGWSKLVKAHAVKTSVEVARTVARAMGAERFAADQRLCRTLHDLEAFGAAGGPVDPVLQAAEQRFVQYSAAILDEISEPTSTMARPDFGSSRRPQRGD